MRLEKHWQRSTYRRIATVSVLWLSWATVATGATPADARLAGSWVLVEGASDNFDAAMTTYIAASRERQTQRRVRRLSDIEQIAGAQDDVPPEEAERTRTRLIEAFKPTANLLVVLNGESLTVTTADGLSRSYTLEENATRMDSSGVATVSARWSGSALVIRSKYTNKAMHSQQLSLDRTGNILTVLLLVKDPSSAQLQINSTYRRE